jgi:hypothetical protein
MADKKTKDETTDRRDTVVSIRLSEDEAQALREQAKREGQPLSAVVRRAVLGAPASPSMTPLQRTTNPNTVSVSGVYSTRDGGRFESSGQVLTPNLNFESESVPSRWA